MSGQQFFMVTERSTVQQTFTKQNAFRLKPGHYITLFFFQKQHRQGRVLMTWNTMYYIFFRIRLGILLTLTLNCVKEI